MPKQPNPAYMPPEAPKDTNPLAVHQYYMSMSDYHDRHAQKHARLRGLQKLWSDSRSHHDDRHNFHKAMRDGYAQKALQIDIRGESQQSAGGFGKMKESIEEDYSSDDMSHARDIAISHGYRSQGHDPLGAKLVHNISRHELYIGKSGDQIKWHHFSPDGGRKLASGDDLGRMRQHLTSFHRAKPEESVEGKLPEAKNDDLHQHVGLLKQHGYTQTSYKRYSSKPGDVASNPDAGKRMDAGRDSAKHQQGFYTDPHLDLKFKGPHGFAYVSMYKGRNTNGTPNDTVQTFMSGDNVKMKIPGTGVVRGYATSEPKDLGKKLKYLNKKYPATESCECPKCGSQNTSTYDDSDREKCADCGHVFVEAFSGTAPTGVLKVQSAPNLKLLQPKAPEKKVAVGSTKYDTSKVRKAVERHLSLDSLLRF